MALDVFLAFDGDCRKAVEFYAKFFGVKTPVQMMTYGQNPDGTADSLLIKMPLL